MTKLLSVQDAAELLSISRWTVRAYIRQGKLRPVRIGRRVLLREEEIERFVEARSPNPENPVEKGGTVIETATNPVISVQR